jgi:hypothetical protein
MRPKAKLDRALSAFPSNGYVEVFQPPGSKSGNEAQYMPISLIATAAEGDLGGTALQPGDLDTFAELQALVADATIIQQTAMDTVAEVNAIITDGTLYNQALRLSKGAGITDGAGAVARSSIIVEGEFTKTTLFVDLTDLKSSTTDLDIIGVEGADLAVNGAFAADTDWTKGADWSIAAGVATAAPGAGTVLEPAVPLVIEAGATYEVTYTMSGFVAGTCTGSIGGTALTARGSDATFVERVVATDTSNLLFTSDAAADYDIDDVIVKKISGAFIGPFTASEVGTLFRGEVKCLEVPAGGVTDIDFYSAAEATGLFDDAVTGLTETVVRTNGGAWSADINAAIALTALPADGEYLYFACGAAGVPGTFTGGQFEFSFWGS